MDRANGNGPQEPLADSGESPRSRESRAEPTGAAAVRAATAQSALIRACRREPVPHTPVWFMRQAGRSLPEYRKLREGVPMLTSCMTPELVAEITLQPVRRYGVDAAIFFSDIVVPLKAIGVDLDIEPGVGPGRRRADPHRAPTWTGCARWTPDDVAVRHRGGRPAHRRARADRR